MYPSQQRHIHRRLLAWINTYGCPGITPPVQHLRLQDLVLANDIHKYGWALIAKELGLRLPPQVKTIQHWLCWPHLRDELAMFRANHQLDRYPTLDELAAAGYGNVVDAINTYGREVIERRLHQI